VALNHLGSRLEKAGDFAEALICFERALKIEPGFSLSHFNLAVALGQLGRHHAALETIERALQLDPGKPEIHLARALALLLLGRWRDGWDAYEWRWKLPGQAPAPQPLWAGEPLAGRPILLQAEQGFGDTIQMLRYVPLVAERGGRVTLVVPDNLERLAGGVPGVEAVVKPDRLPPVDLHLPLLSLPRVFGTEPSNVPAPIRPVLPAAGVGDRVRHYRGPRIGIAWAGRPGYLNDFARSIPLGVLEPLLSLAGATFFSLQKGPAEREIEDYGFAGRLVPLGPLLGDFADTAVAIDALDLVISVDTAVAHLAGTLGKRVWILLRLASEWRWLAGDTTSVWYPSARLFRQTRANDWQEVVAAVAEALRREFGSSA
jgi:hypothetical protein